MTDLRYAFRQLLKYPGFTAVAVLTLALGIGANTAIFSVVNGVLLKPLQYDQPGQLVQVWEAPSPGKRNSVSPGVFLDWKQQSVTFDSLAAYNNADMNLTGNGEPERLNGLRMSDNGFNPQSFGSAYWNLRANLVVRTSVAPRGLAESVRQAILGVDPDQPVTNVRTMEEVTAASVVQGRFILMLLGVFAGVALSLAAIGLYGVIAYAVSQRTREFGIRMALGATRQDVLSLMLGQGTKLAAIGILVGVVGALGLTRVLVSLLYEVKPTDPLTFVGVALFLLLVSLFASWLPARRAAKVDPMEALRCE